MPVSATSINEWILAQPSLVEQYSLDDEFDILHYVCACTSKMAELLKLLGLYTDGTWLNFDESQFPIIIAIADAVRREYDSPDDPSPLWDYLGCSGDDDVDYNSSYLYIATELLTAYSNRGA